MKKLIFVMFIMVLVLQACGKKETDPIDTVIPTMPTETLPTETDPTVIIPDIYLNTHMYHSIHSSFSPFITIEDDVVIHSVMLNDATIQENVVLFTYPHLSINHTYLNTLNAGVYQLSILTSKGYINMELTLVDDTKPYVVSSSYSSYNEGTDVSFLIETFSEGIDIISTTGGIDSTYYHFENGILTIHHGFFDLKLHENPERQVVIFMIAVTYNNQDTMIITLQVGLQ